MAEATWQRVLAAELNERGPGALADSALATVGREMPLLRDDPDLRDLARSSIVANLLLVADITAGKVSLRDAAPPPQAGAFARELARRNVPMSDLARSYRVLQHEMWRVGVGQIHARMDAADRVAAAVEELTDATFATGEVLMSAALEAFAAERERWARSADAMRSETVRALLDGEPLDVDAAAARLRYELRREHVGFVAWGEGHDAISAAAGGPGALLIPLGSGVTAGWCAPDTLTAPAEGRIAIGTPGTGVDGFRSTITRRSRRGASPAAPPSRAPSATPTSR